MADERQALAVATGSVCTESEPHSRLAHSHRLDRAFAGEHPTDAPGFVPMGHLTSARTARRPSAALAAALVVLGACSTDEGSSGGGSHISPAEVTDANDPLSDDPTPVDVEQLPASPLEDVPSALAAARGGSAEDLPDPLVPLSELRSGGPPPDGIPPVDYPVYLRAVDVDFVADEEPVLAIEIDGEARAYPVQIMIWHEIVNDTIGSTPVAVTYCPLCNSAVAYDRRTAGRVVTFGTSGMLWNSALVMYDRQTESLWSHFTGQAIAGMLAGAELATFPVATVPWGAWRNAHPDGLVLSRDTGFDRDYGENPYPGYDDITADPFLFEGEVDGRFTAMTRVVGISVDDAATAVPLVALRATGALVVEVAGSDLTVWWQAGTNSALDTADIADGADVGTTAVFVPVVDGRKLTFAPAAGGTGFVDKETGSTWDLFGNAIDGPLAGVRLEAVEHVDTFWFAWSTFRPDTTVFAGDE